MKFGDKLIVLRKKNGLSQEQLAEKLDVSRQSVSKWESNNTYPETDKIVQICNLFDCSMDDLINDKVTDVEGSLRKNKNNFNIILDSFLEFITKSVDMFSKMKFSSGLKCVIEMIILIVLLWVAGMLFCNLIVSILMHIFMFLPIDVVNVIRIILKGIINILFFIVGVIIVIHTFKVRYLDYYDKTMEEKNSEEKSKNNNKEEKFDTKKETVVIRDEKHSTYAFLGVLSTIVIWFIKFIVFFIVLSLAATALGLIITSVISISLIPTNLFFLGVSLSLISASLFTVLITIILIYFIINKKVNVKLDIILFIISFVVFGIGLGLSAISFKNIDVEDNNKYLVESSITKNIDNNTVIDYSHDFDDLRYKYVIDNNMKDNEVIISKKIDKRFEKLTYHSTFMDKINVIDIDVDFYEDFNKVVKDFMKDLKHNKIYTNSDDELLIIKGNKKTIDNILSNVKKLYIIETKTTDNTIDVRIDDFKVYIEGDFDSNEVEYDAIKENIIIHDEDIKCNKSINETRLGSRIIYKCIEEDID